MEVINGNCIEVLKTLKENSVDSVVTDPPYEIGFMGKSWDSSGIANNPEMWKECLRVLKPGGFLLSFSATRTYHRMAVGIEDAGFEIRDMIEWVYGSGFPKSHNIGKAVDKLQGNERKIIGYKEPFGREGRNTKPTGNYNAGLGGNYTENTKDLRPIYDSTSEYEGWGTALKPAHEPICMARKPLAEKTVAENCLEWGTGGINIDESRVGYASDKDCRSPFNSKGELGGDRAGLGYGFDNKNHEWDMNKQKELGRFPANLILGADENGVHEEVRACFPESKSTGGTNPAPQNKIYGKRQSVDFFNYGDQGNASRFFKSIIYQAKPSKKERNAGCEGLEEKETKVHIQQSEGRKNQGTNKGFKVANNHPTVKPIALMEYLIKMVTPKGGVVLDPFMGSGTTGCAAVKNGFDFIGIDMEEEYIKIATARINHYKTEQQQKLF